MAATILDTIAALRVVYLLITPIESTSAFKLGLLDSSGKTVRKAVTSDEKNSTSMLHRLVWNLKRMISLIPGGSTKIGSAVAAYLLMREAVENNWSEAELNEQCITRFNELCEADCPEFNGILDELYRIDEEECRFNPIDEDAPANATGAGVATFEKKLGTLNRRKKFKAINFPESLDI